MNKTILIIVGLAIAAVIGYYIYKKQTETAPVADIIIAPPVTTPAHTYVDASPISMEKIWALGNFKPGTPLGYILNYYHLPDWSMQKLYDWMVVHFATEGRG